MIERALLRGAGRRGDLGRALASASLDGLGLGRDETLLIPRVAMDERLDRHGSNLPFARSFARQLRASLERAELDPRGAVAAGKPVRFSSKARLAAWLLGNDAASKPYLRGLLADHPGASDASDWARRMLLRDGPALVHCAAQLLDQGQLARWLSTLAVADIATVSATVCESFSISPRLVGGWGPGNAAVPPRSAPLSLLTPGEARIAANVAHQFREACDPSARHVLGAVMAWCALFPSASRGVRLRAFIAAVLGDGVGDREGESAPAQPAAPPLARLLVEPSTAAGATAAGGAGAQASHRSPTLAETRGLGQAQAKRDATALAPPPISPPHGRPATPLAPDVTDPAVAASDLSAGDFTLETQVFASGYCGLLFLCGVLTRLGYCRDFGREDRAGCDLAPFDLLDRLGLHWFGEPYRASPLHRWLRDNAAEQDPLDHFTLPHGCSLANSGPQLTLARDGRHLTVWHSEGFPLSDRPLGDFRRTRRKLLALHGPRRFAGGAIRKSRSRLPQAAGARWIACLARVIEAEMRRRGGEYGLSPRDMAQGGVVKIVDGQVIVDLDLGELPFAVRYAGLDRDPGWIVREGRSLAFNYR